MSTPSKIYIAVTSYTTPEGKITPLSVTWEDGRTFEIDRITGIRQAASKAGGNGTRYTCYFLGQQRYLFLQDDGRWFVEVNP